MKICLGLVALSLASSIAWGGKTDQRYKSRDHVKRLHHMVDYWDVITKESEDPLLFRQDLRAYRKKVTKFLSSVYRKFEGTAFEFAEIRNRMETAQERWKRLTRNLGRKALRGPLVSQEVIEGFEELRAARRELVHLAYESYGARKRFFKKAAFDGSLPENKDGNFRPGRGFLRRWLLNGGPCPWTDHLKGVPADTIRLVNEWLSAQHLKPSLDGITFHVGDGRTTYAFLAGEADIYLQAKSLLREAPDASQIEPF